MLKFDYEAKDQSTGKHVRATVEAESERAAAKLLMEQGFIPINITEQSEKKGLFSSFTNRITTKDKVVFTRQLSTLISAGLPLTQSLTTVVDQTSNKRLKSVAQDILTSVEAGNSLSNAFGKHPEVFDKVYIALIAAGETSGTLDKALERIADQQEKDAEMISKIRGAMVYPVIVLVVIMLVLGFMLFTIVPQVEKLYQDLSQELPFITAILVGAANFVIQFWWVAVIILIAAGYFLKQYLETDNGQTFKDSTKLNLPIFGEMFRKLYMARFMRTGQTLLATGVPLLDALRIAARAVNNSIIERSILRASEKVKGGKGLADSLQHEAYILPLVPQMLKIGEQSGRIDEMMGKTASVYESELDSTIKSISTAIEPVLMVVLAIVAGLMVAAILLPIYGLVETIRT
ncbi:MAG TPA: type II secretion system F family protein [Verrucomicrobiae bacterium]|nr:type II secretion system F family protein [Verrucomicrobiae bacterium]